jgi:hypothetical protein
MTPAFWKSKLRVRWIGASRAGAERTINYADVFETSETEARAWIAAGLAEETDDPVGPAPTLSEFKTCWRCSASQPFNVVQCFVCGFPI